MSWWASPSPRRLLEGGGVGYKKSCGGGFCRGAPWVIQVLREVHEDRRQQYLEKLKIQNGLTMTLFLLGWSRLAGNTPRTYSVDYSQ